MASGDGSRHKGRLDAGGGRGAGSSGAAGGSESLGLGGAQASGRGLPSEQGKSGRRDNARAVPGNAPDSRRPGLDEVAGCSERAAGSRGAGCSQRVAVSADLSAKEHVDVFGHRHPPVAADVIDCYNCGRPVAAGRFAPHLHKCMGKGRQASRQASRAWLGMLSGSSREKNASGASRDKAPSRGRRASPGAQQRPALAAGQPQGAAPAQGKQGSQWRQDAKKKAHLDALVLAETAGECQGDVATAAWVERHTGAQERDDGLDCPAARTRSHGGSSTALPPLSGQPSVCHHEVPALSAGLPGLRAAGPVGAHTQHAQATAPALDLDSVPCLRLKGGLMSATKEEGDPSVSASRPPLVPVPSKTDASPSSSDNTSTTTAETCRESLSPCSVVEDHGMADVGGTRLASATEGQGLHAPNPAMLLDCLAVSAACLPGIVPTRKRCGRPPVCEPSCARRVKR